MEKKREDLIMCPNCQVPNSPDSLECYGCGYELIKKTIQLELSKDQARFLRALLNIFWTTFNKWTPFAKLADDYPGCDLIVLADRITRKLEHALGER
jgi:hypothetical protein